MHLVLSALAGAREGDRELDAEEGGEGDSTTVLPVMRDEGGRNGRWGNGDDVHFYVFGVICRFGIRCLRFFRTDGFPVKLSSLPGSSSSPPLHRPYPLRRKPQILNQSPRQDEKQAVWLQLGPV